MNASDPHRSRYSIRIRRFWLCSQRDGKFPVCCGPRRSSTFGLIAGILALLLPASHATAEENEAAAKTAATSDAQPGHSFHDDAFNEGPRQAAYLMQGMGNVHWPTSTPSAMAQRFFDQGLSQLHGFWYFEAERSFRQASAIDPECAIHYWGMARANVENPSRSAGFIEQAMQRIDQANKVERRLIETWSRRVKDWPEEPNAKTDDDSSEKRITIGKRNERSTDLKDATRDQRKNRLKEYVKDLESIAVDYPQDIEIKAMLILQYWQNDGAGIELQSHLAIDALLSELFALSPRHPAHHFRIHLWDYRNEKLAITAAAQCGPSAPGIAHMWHMPGHTYSRLNRYSDAAWQQEASARVDHAHMIRDAVMPDQIHNYAHNNEWLIRNWLFLGRVNDAISLAKNMIELPRHPSFNAPKGSGSASYGRQRLIGALSTYQRWSDMLEACDSIYLTGNSDAVELDATQVLRAIALAQLGRVQEAELERDRLLAVRKSLRAEIQSLEVSDSKLTARPPKLEEPFPAPADLFSSENETGGPAKVSEDFDEERWKDSSPEQQAQERRKHELNYRHYRLGQSLNGLLAHLFAVQGQYREAVRASQAARGNVDPLLRIEWASRANEHELAVRKMREAFDAAPGQLMPAALAVWVANEAILNQPQSTSLDSWKELRNQAIAQTAVLAASGDSSIPWVDRAHAIATAEAPETQWATPATPPSDTGDRPPLDTLGPVRWTPPMAPRWSLPMADGREESSKRLEGKPYVMILYLGFGCLHCAEQLSKFSPMLDPFQEAGIEVIGVSTETLASLRAGLKDYDGEMRIPLAANPDLDVFKAFRCFDDFEGQPLHGTIFVDAQGRIRWQDIGHEPFMDVDFLRTESKRLLQLP